jgi:hypothetical protein
MDTTVNKVNPIQGYNLSYFIWQCIALKLGNFRSTPDNDIFPKMLWHKIKKKKQNKVVGLISGLKFFFLVNARNTYIRSYIVLDMLALFFFSPVLFSFYFLF